MGGLGGRKGGGEWRSKVGSVLSPQVHKTQITISRQYLLAKGPNSSAVSACARSFKPEPELCPCQAISIFKAFCFGSMPTKLNLILSMVLSGKPSRLPRDSQTGTMSADSEASTSAAGASSDKSWQSMPASPDEKPKDGVSVVTTANHLNNLMHQNKGPESDFCLAKQFQVTSLPIYPTHTKN